ncbi:GNAT family N-acetyltransferase [Pseudonocardia spinosispora]|uniref:GNAT family N-acetyltransferase n=1 Tax=Pseudonocardia spinosispora TaxID=103441 RepID=UPI000685D61F|nr:GNAT family N-acetyltransferase [Pseudonocardia spinosispora]
MGNPVEIAVVPAEASADVVAQLTELINTVYAVAEEGLWRLGAARTSVEEMTSLVGAGEIVAALLDDEIVGAMRLRELDSRTAEFGMLVAAPDRRGFGIGRQLVRFAETGAMADGLEIMQLELLVPVEWNHPSKDFLASWYTRMGYRVVSRGTVEASYPPLAPLLATRCEMLTWHRNLI